MANCLFLVLTNCLGPDRREARHSLHVTFFLFQFCLLVLAPQ